MTNLPGTPPTIAISDSHSHLREYLDYYKNLSNPGYGVLITGDWGSGKTFQVKEILTDDKIYYISLFGTQTTEEVYSSVYAKMFPCKAKIKNAVASTEGAEVGALGLTINLGGMVSGVANAMLREEVKTDRVLVFDDLERSSIKIEDLLGIFNNYIEHHECKLLVIAHDEKIEEDLKNSKEKVFGQTIGITPQTSKAFNSFTSSLKDPKARDIIKELKEDIICIFQESSTHSLRILKYTLEDLGRLFKTLKDEQKSNKEAIREITLLFLALSLEVRSGSLKENDLINRKHTIMKYQMQRARDKDNPSPTAPAIYESNNRYSSVDLDNNILKDTPLINTLIKGNYIEKEIQDSLSESLYFIKPESLAPWILFMNFDSISDIESNDAAEKLKRQFDSREICIPGEMLHLFALRFLFSEIEIISTNLSQTENDCKSYIDDLLSQDKIPPNLEYKDSWSDELMYGYGGFGFWVEDNYKDNFKNIVDHFKTAQGKATQKSFPEHSKELLKLISTDGGKFAQQISTTFSGNNTFARVDILASIDPSDFVQEWMGSHPRNWHSISRALEQRYSTGLLYNVLMSEKKWLSEVIALLDHQHRKAVHIRKKRIERILPHSLREYAS